MLPMTWQVTGLGHRGYTFNYLFPEYRKLPNVNAYFQLQYEMGILVIFVFMFYVGMTQWAREETLMLIEKKKQQRLEY